MLWEEAQKGANAGKVVLFSPWQLPFVWTNNLRREQKSSCLLNAKPQKHGAFLAPARRKFLVLGIPDDSPSGAADWGDKESTHCPQSPFHWAEATSLVHNSVGQETREAEISMPGQAKPEGGCDGEGWPESKSLMHMDALPASCLFSWPEQSVKRAQNLVLKGFGVCNIYRLIHTYTHAQKHTNCLWYIHLVPT